MNIEKIKTKIEYFSYMAKNWKDDDVVVIEKDVVFNLIKEIEPKNNVLLHDVTHRYFTLSEAKPENSKPCIVNNGADNYHIAFWDEEDNGFVNQTGYLQKEFDKWLYLPINGG